jgi:hypothetical protein
MMLPLVAAGAAVLIVALIIGSQLLGDTLKTRASMIREQKAREDYASAQNRARDAYERDIDLVASVLDPIGIFH